MLGLAQTLYLKQANAPAWASKYKLHTHLHWPFLEKLVETSTLSYVDFLLAETLLAEYPHASEAIAIFICHLSLAARHGHLCIAIEDNSIFPDPHLLWSQEGENKLSQQELDAICALIREGASILPHGLISENPKHPQTALCRFQNLYYLQRYWLYESQILHHYNHWITQKPDLQLNNSYIQNVLKKLTEESVLLAEQADAIFKACQSNFTIICGGPGTGKTYTAGHLIRLYWQALPPEERQNCVISLAAPTGKAAANLQKSLAKQTAELEGFKPIVAKTLHSLLGINSKKYKSEDDLPPAVNADLLIVDESSMIDVKLMATLFAALKPGSRLVLLGDPHQLPSVEAGSLFSDLLSISHSQTIMLKKCLRAELKEIVDFAAAVNSGDILQANALINLERGIKKVCFDTEQPQLTQQAILNYAMPFFACFISTDLSEKDILNRFNQFRMLSPLRKGPLGVNEINAQLYRKIVKQAKGRSWMAFPIMLTSHDHRLGLFNGEVGVLVRSSHESDHFQKGDYALFTDRQGGILKIPALLLPKFEYAFCLSVHKSQGSEFDNIFLLLPEGSEYFGREVFYTAATRAKQQLMIWSSETIIHKTISAKSHRLSGLPLRMLMLRDQP